MNADPINIDDTETAATDTLGEARKRWATSILKTANKPENYNRKGWDIIAECFDVAELVSIFEDFKIGTYREALAEVIAHRDLHAERRDEIESEIF